jgi:hypothetical protein
MEHDLRELLETMTGADFPVELHPSRLVEISLAVPHSIAALPASYGQPLEDFNCVMYALDLVGMIDDPSGRPFGMFYADTLFLSSLIETGRLAPTVESKGALAVWSDNGHVKHIGVITNAGRAASKWGIGHLYEHGLFELPKSYGDEIAFYEPLDSEPAFELLCRHCGVK